MPLGRDGYEVLTLFQTISDGLTWNVPASALASIELGGTWVTLFYFYVAFCSSSAKPKRERREERREAAGSRRAGAKLLFFWFILILYIYTYILTQKRWAGAFFILFLNTGRSRRPSKVGGAPICLSGSAVGFQATCH